MFVSYKHLLALIAACVGIIAVVVAYKITRSLSDDNSVSPLRPVETVQTLEPDVSFYGLGGGTKTAKPSGDPATPGLTAYSYLVGNVSTGKIYMEKNADVVLPVASMSKLITAIAATDYYSATTTIMVTEPETLVASDTSQLVAGERFTLKEMLYPMLLNSSNVAAEALASSTDRAKFMELMSSYAWEVGMPGSYFADPSGLSPQNTATAHDFFALAKYLYLSRPDILSVTRMARFDVATTTDHHSHSFISIHPFVNAANFLGGKTGHTDQAGDTMLTILNIGGQPIAFIVLKSVTGGRAGDTQLLIDAYQRSR